MTIEMSGSVLVRDLHDIGRLVRESETRCVIVHYFQIEIQDCVGIVGVSGGVSVRAIQDDYRQSRWEDSEVLSEIRDIWRCVVPIWKIIG